MRIVLSTFDLFIVDCLECKSPIHTHTHIREKRMHACKKIYNKTRDAWSCIYWSFYPWSSMKKRWRRNFLYRFFFCVCCSFALLGTFWVKQISVSCTFFSSLFHFLCFFLLFLSGSSIPLLRCLDGWTDGRRKNKRTKNILTVVAFYGHQCTNSHRTIEFACNFNWFNETRETARKRRREDCSFFLKF